MTKLSDLKDTPIWPMFKWSMICSPLLLPAILLIGVLTGETDATVWQTVLHDEPEILILVPLGVLAWWVFMGMFFGVLLLPFVARSLPVIGEGLHQLFVWIAIIGAVALVIVFPIFFAVVIGLILLAAIANGVNQ